MIENFGYLIRFLVLLTTFGSVLAVILTGYQIIKAESSEEVSQAKTRLKTIIIAIIIVALIGGIGGLIFKLVAGGVPNISPTNGSYNNDIPLEIVKNRKGIAQWLLNILVGLIGWFVEGVANALLVPLYTSLYKVANTFLFTIPDPFDAFIAGRGVPALAKRISFPLAAMIIIVAIIMAALNAVYNNSSSRNESVFNKVLHSIFLTILALIGLGAFVALINKMSVAITTQILYATKLTNMYSVNQTATGARISVGVGDIILNASQNFLNTIEWYMKNPTATVTLMDAFGPYLPSGPIYLESPYHAIAFGAVSIMNLGFALTLSFVGIMRIVYYYILVAVGPIVVALYSIPGQEKSAQWWLKEFIAVSLVPILNAIVYYFSLFISEIVMTSMGVNSSGTYPVAQALIVSVSIFVGIVVLIYLLKDSKKLIEMALSHTGNTFSQASGALGQFLGSLGGAIAVGGIGASIAGTVAGSVAPIIGGAIGGIVDWKQKRPKAPSGGSSAGVNGTLPSSGGGSTGVNDTQTSSGSGRIPPVSGSQKPYNEDLYEKIRNMKDTANTTNTEGKITFEEFPSNGPITRTTYTYNPRTDSYKAKGYAIGKKIGEVSHTFTHLAENATRRTEFIRNAKME